LEHCWPPSWNTAPPESGPPESPPPGSLPPGSAPPESGPPVVWRGEGGAAYFHTGMRGGGGACPATGLTAPPWLSLLLCCGCVAVRLCGWPPAPVAMDVEVSVGYVRWVGVWARAWEGRAARGAQWRGSGLGGEGTGMGGWEIGEGVGWAGERIRWGSGISGRFGHDDRRA
jgi:hypothetical protein